ncbi:S9 family peptidase [Flavilitoribacter nigricans DSM 23189 = NBRC 102662]|uniref:S9 family peptidase n=2 Tax=Flavilitoribacter TaxID=2762562 RepID=A0A2D0N0Q4_FLAN2|nr:S9 family peptidase [Flavilitoribacter nigricans DSM 23189 = NBRC 102662]
MQGEDFVGYLPESVRWGTDSRTIYFSWNPDGDTLRSDYRIRVGENRPVKVTDEELKAMPGRGSYNTDRDQMVYSRNGDLYWMETGTGKTRQLTNTVGYESSPEFSGDDQFIVYESDNNLFTWEIATGEITQLTNFIKGNKRSSRSSEGQKKWLEDQQMELFDVLRERKAVSDARRKRREQLEPDRPVEIYYGSKRIGGMTASPDLRYVAYRLTTTVDDKISEMPQYVTESGYAEMARTRPKVGDIQDSYDSYLYDRQRDTFYTIKTGEIPGIKEKPAYLFEYHEGEEEFEREYKNDRDVIVAGPYFSDNGQAVVVIRSLDNKDRWIMQLDLETGSLKLLDRQRDEAWVGGPGISGWNFSGGTIGWLPDNEHIYFQSEATGFSHLYLLNVKTGDKKALTNGKFEIISAQLSNDGSTFYIVSNAESPHEHHFYHLPAMGGKMQKITQSKGGHEVDISPDEKYLAIRFSTSNQPWELYVMENKAGAEMTRLTESTTEAFGTYDWRKPEIVRFRAADGAQVPARIYRPENPTPDGPAVIFVHGAGYLQNVHEWWSSYFREYMFHNILVDNGYTVLDIDYRASDGYGRDWRTAIYRHMGGKDLSDQVDGAKYLVDEWDVDADRIGIYGGSYGGFITLMALFNNPGTFKSGAALRSVTDWAHYNHGYTANILNTPTTDSIAYQRSSPINFAEGLEDQLLILHGMVDSNVQFQDVVRLAQRLIELGKDNWEFAVFPLESHGFVEPSSWTDEYKRIFRLFQETLK